VITRYRTGDHEIAGLIETMSRTEIAMIIGGGAVETTPILRRLATDVPIVIIVIM